MPSSIRPERKWESVVVTGGAGRLGRYVVDEFLQAGFEVRVADLVTDERVSDAVVCDVLDPAQVRAALDGADAVCHLAGLDSDGGAPGADLIWVNLVGAWNVLVSAADSPLAEPTLDWYARRVGKLPPLRDARLYEQNPRASAFSHERAAAELGWSPRLTLADLGASPLA